MKPYVLYGTGEAAEQFFFRNKELLKQVDYCIDAIHAGTGIAGMEIVSLEEARDLKNHKIIVTTKWPVYLEIKEILKTEFELTEYQDFIWGEEFQKKVVVINANCYGEALTRFLMSSKQFMNDYIIHPIKMIQRNKGNRIDEQLLARTDVYIHQIISSSNPYSEWLSDEYILPKLKQGCKVITIPNFWRRAEWLYPQIKEIRDTDIHNRSYYYYRDTIMDEAIEEKGYRTVSEIEEFYRSYSYPKQMLKELGENGLAKIQYLEKKWDVKVYSYIMKHLQEIPCFIDKDHPSVYLMGEITRQVAEMLNITDYDPQRQTELGTGNEAPLLPSIRNFYHMNWIKPLECRNLSLGPGYSVMDYGMVAYISEYAWWFYGMDLNENS